MEEEAGKQEQAVVRARQEERMKSQREKRSMAGKILKMEKENNELKQKAQEMQKAFDLELRRAHSARSASGTGAVGEKRKHSFVDLAGGGNSASAVLAEPVEMHKMFEQSYDTAIPYMHMALHCENMVNRDPLTCTAEHLEHTNKSAKADGKLTSGWRPSDRPDAAQFSVSGSVLTKRCGLEAAACEVCPLPLTDTEKRRLRGERKRKTTDLTAADVAKLKKRKHGQLQNMEVHKPAGA